VVQAIGRDVAQRCAAGSADGAEPVVVGGWTIHADGGRTYKIDDARSSARTQAHRCAL
jgi:hypothetical protein